MLPNIRENDTTNAVEFWKSNRKILTASSLLYTLTSLSANPDCAMCEKIDLTCSEDASLDSPASKCLCISTKLDQILEAVEALKRRNKVFDRISSMSECVVFMQKPQFGPCCRMIIGCQPCVQRWFDNDDTCPHWSSCGAALAYTDVRGMDVLLHFAQTLGTAQ